LVSLSNGEYLIKVALEAPHDTFPDSYYLEPDNKQKIMDLLPLHCKSFGNIVEVEEIFEIAIPDVEDNPTNHA